MQSELNTGRLPEIPADYGWDDQNQQYKRGAISSEPAISVVTAMDWQWSVTILYSDLENVIDKVFENLAYL